MFLSGQVSLDRAVDLPLSRQLYLQIKEQIELGRLQAGAKLPTSRALAKELEIGRNSVLSAYEQLILEGYLASHGRRGTVVSEASRGFSEFEDVRGKVERKAPVLPLSRQGKDIAKVRRREAPVLRTFQTGLPEVRLFPHDLWARHLRRAARHMQLDPQAGGYGDYFGVPELRKAIIKHVRLTRGVSAEPEQVIVLSSAQAAMDVTTRLLMDPDDVALVEEPGYGGARASLLAVGAQMHPVAVDQEDVYSQLDENLKPKLIYATPSHQYPTGRLMRLEERLSLLDYAEKTGAYILEDDYDSEFHFRGTPVACLQGLDRYQRVIYMGTFSKSLMPALHGAYLIVPEHMVRPLESMVRNVGCVPAHVVQYALASFMEEGHFRAHIRAMCGIYQERRDALMSGLERYCKGLLVPRLQDGGIQMVAEFGPDMEALGWDDQQLAHALVQSGVDVGALSSVYWSGCVARKQGLFLGYAASNLADIDAALAKMGELIKSGPAG